MNYEIVPAQIKKYSSSSRIASNLFFGALCVIGIYCPDCLTFWYLKGEATPGFDTLV
jgi:hypothetical protein